LGSEAIESRIKKRGGRGKPARKNSQRTKGGLVNTGSRNEREKRYAILPKKPSEAERGCEGGAGYLYFRAFPAGGDKIRNRPGTKTVIAIKCAEERKGKALCDIAEETE